MAEATVIFGPGVVRKHNRYSNRTLAKRPQPRTSLTNLITLFFVHSSSLFRPIYRRWAVSTASTVGFCVVQFRSGSFVHG